MGENGLSASDVAVLSGNYGRSNNGGGFGDGDWGAWIILFLLFGLFGNRGFGGGFGGNGGNGGCCCEPCATKADLTAQGIVQKLDGITYGISDSTYALNNSIMTGFHGVDNAICNLGYNVQSGFNTLGHQISDCCCTTQRLVERGFCDLGNAMNLNTRDILESNNSNTRAILDFLVQSKMDEKDGKIAELQSELMLSRQNAFFTANQDAQTAELIRRMGRDFPVNAVVVQPNTPVTFPTNCCGQFSGYNNNGCGCGNF